MPEVCLRTPLGNLAGRAYNAPLDPLAGLGEPLRSGRDGKRGEEGRRGDKREREREERGIRRETGKEREGK